MAKQPFKAEVQPLPVQAPPEAVQIALHGEINAFADSALSAAYAEREYYLHRDLFRDAFVESLSRLGHEASTDLTDWYLEAHRDSVFGSLEMKPDCISTLQGLRERGLRLLEKSGRVLGNAQRVGTDGAYSMRIEAAQPLGIARRLVEVGEMNGAGDGDAGDNHGDIHRNRCQLECQPTGGSEGAHHGEQGVQKDEDGDPPAGKEYPEGRQEH